MSGATNAGDDVGGGQRRTAIELEAGLFRSKFTEEMLELTPIQAELRKVEGIPDGDGERLMNTFARFNMFPWAQDTVVAAAQLDEVLIMFLHKHLRLQGETLRT